MMMKMGKRVYEHTTTHIMERGAWSPMGAYLAAADMAGWLYVWEAETGQKVFERQAHEYSLSALIWSPTGRELVSCDTAGRVIVWELPLGSMRYVYQYPEEESDAEGRGGSQTKAAWSPDGLFLASNGLVGSKRVLEVWNASTGERRAAWAVGPYVASLLWSPNGKYLAMGDDRGVVHLWDPFTGKRVKSYRRPRMTQLQHVIHTSRLAWSSDAKYLACGDTLGIVHIWDVEKKQLVAVYAQESNAIEEIVSWKPPMITGLAWLPDEQYLASASRAMQVRQIPSGELRKTVYNPFEGREKDGSDQDNALVFAIDWSPKRSQVVSVGGYQQLIDGEVHIEGFVRVWSVEEEEIANY